MKYVHAVNFKDDDYEVATASTDDEIKQLGKAGWVKYDDKNGVSYYRKPKKFRSLQ
jgi:ribosomal protein L19E